MTPEMSAALAGSGLTLIPIVIIGAIGYGRLQGQVETEKIDREKLDKDVWREVSKLREWRHDHEQDSARVRLELEKESGRLREMIAVKDAKLDEIIRRLDEVNKRLERMEGQK